MGIGTALYNGLSGLNSYSTALSVVSDNVANANTTAFKSNSVRFGDMVNSYYASLTNDTEREGAGSTIMSFATNFGQGNLMATESWSDLALGGNGFFEVNDPSTTNSYFTRDGSFRLYTDAAGDTYLVNPQGYHVRNDAGADIVITNADTYSKFRVGEDGQIYGTAAGVETALAGAKIGLTVFTNENGLVREGHNLYSQGPDSGTATRSDTGAAGLYGTVNDYNLEGSNVDLAKEMVDMIIYQASYNANSKTITTDATLLDTTINMVR
jgi:flagellar hook protein FlgE